MSDTSERIQRLFAGLKGAHGTYEVQTTQANGKKTGKAVSIREPVTTRLWEQHLTGKRSLGIVPICEDNTANWGCIDIDVYPNDNLALLARVRQMKLPLVMCRTKSGGAHLFLFVLEPVPARAMQQKLREIAAGLGYASSEIFPKQITILFEKGDNGNWLNMPYFGGDSSTRYAYKDNGEAATMAEFVVLAEGYRVSPDALDAIQVVADQETVQEGPPCLEFLVNDGFPSGTRNNGLLALGVYFKKAHPDDWVEKLEEFNRQSMTPPKDSAELQDIIKSLKRKDYSYRCSEPPIAQHCNKAICLTRKYGIGVVGNLAVLSDLVKQNSDPPIWFLSVDGERLDCSTEELMNQHRFQTLVLAKLNKLPPKYKEPQWHALINALLAEVTVIEVPEDVSIGGHFDDLLQEFCTARYVARDREELLLGKPWTDDGRTYLHLGTLMDFLTKEQKFTGLNRPQVVHRIRNNHDGKDMTWTLKGAPKRLWSIKAFDRPDGPIALPALSSAVL